ncbi:MAG TPA: aromatic ring-hydroxylating dioxygenase subunit alpha [Candidatus Obscuribacterales bacterium]
MTTVSTIDQSSSVAQSDACLNDSAELQTSYTEKQALVGTTYVKNMWYYAFPSEKVKKGKMVSKNMLGDLILIGRDADGKVFAMQNVCPHQGMPLTDGEFDGRHVECPFHGWKFDTEGVCREIPSLVEGQKVNICKIRTRSYIAAEEQGSIWIFYGDKTENLPDVPKAPGLGNLKYDKTTSTLIIPTHIDYAVVALIDTAHVPYVHKSWWWRSKRRMKEKAKTYVPSETGWTMVRHSPSKSSIVFKLLGDFMETEISFRLPGCRREYITLGGRTLLAGISTCTPIDEHTTELNHTTYWTIPFIKPFIKPFVDYFVREFLGQDQKIARRQKVGLKYNPRLTMTIKDAGTPGSWYFQLKREWNAATEEGRAFVNPIKEKILRWRT